MTSTRHDDAPTTGRLVSDLSQEVSRLVRDELQLARLEMSGKAKQAGVGAGMFGVAGVLGLFGLGALITTAILALAIVLDAWLAALIVGMVLLAAAGVTALIGRRRVRGAVPPVPTETVESVKADVDVVRNAGGHHG